MVRKTLKNKPSRKMASLSVLSKKLVKHERKVEKCTKKKCVKDYKIEEDHFLNSKKECKDDIFCITEGPNGSVMRKLQENLHQCSLKKCKKEIKDLDKSRKLYMEGLKKAYKNNKIKS